MERVGTASDRVGKASKKEKSDSEPFIITIGITTLIPHSKKKDGKHVRMWIFLVFHIAVKPRSKAPAYKAMPAYKAF